MAGSEEEERRKFEAGVKQQRVEGLPLADQLIWRIEQLTSGQSIDLAEQIHHFPEVTEAITPPTLEAKLLGGPERSEASLEDGGSLVLIGGLNVPGSLQLVAKFKRRLQLGQKLAYHEMLEVEPEFRGRGICLQLLRRTFVFYDALGLEEVQVEASLSTGRWYWARVGFEFELPKDREEVKKWAIEVCEALGISSLNVDTYSSAAQFARMGGNRRVSLGQIAAAIPAKAELVKTIAEQNGLEIEERIELGRAVMLTGPEWTGRLQLQGPSRVAFEIAVDGKEERMKREEEAREG